MDKNKLLKNQVVILLIGKNPKLKEDIINKLMNDYNLKDIYSVVDPLRQLISQTLGIALPIFNDENSKYRKIVPPMHMILTKLSKLVLTFRQMLPNSHRFNPYTVGEGQYVMGPFTCPKHALLEIGNKFVNKIMPLFCSTLTYANLEGKKGLYLISGLRRQNEIDLANKLFQNVVTIKIHDSKLDIDYVSYDTEKEINNIKCDYHIKDINDIDDIFNKLSIKELPIKEASRDSLDLVNKNSKALPSNVATGGKNGRFVYEPNTSLPSHADTVVWLKPLNK